MKILFVRHGESIDDIEDRYGGWADFDLTERGKNQCKESAQKISLLNEKFEIVLSSPLKRAYQAAEIIANKLNIEVKVFEYLKERNLNGILSGMIRSEAAQKYPDLVKKHSSYEYVDASERAKDFDTRVKTAIEIVLKMKHHSLVIVTHGLFMRTFFKEMMNTNITKVGDGGFALVEVDNNNFKILKTFGVEYENH